MLIVILVIIYAATISKRHLAYWVLPHMIISTFASKNAPNSEKVVRMNCVWPKHFNMWSCYSTNQDAISLPISMTFKISRGDENAILSYKSILVYIHLNQYSDPSPIKSLIDASHESMWKMELLPEYILLPYLCAHLYRSNMHTRCDIGPHHWLPQVDN